MKCQKKSGNVKKKALQVKKNLFFLDKTIFFHRLQAMTYDVADALLFALEAHPEITTKEGFYKLKNTILAKFSTPTAPTNIELLKRYIELIDTKKISDQLRIRKILRVKSVRSLSGVSVISILTKFWGCPGKCIYCPTFEGVPKSYIPGEPAVERALMNHFDPFLQVQNRLSSLQMTGNALSKNDVRIIGGTWSVYPKIYQEAFIRSVYDAHTYFHQKHPSQGTKIFTFGEDEAGEQTESVSIQTLSESLEEAKERNEQAECRVVGIAVETRPDWVTPEEIIRLRRYGVTRVEIGYQTTDDSINTQNKRGHTNKESIMATRLLKDAGYKVVAHMMPGLVGATVEKDIAAMKEIFDNPDFRPDELKIYPMVVTEHSELTTLWKEGKFEPYNDATLIPLMVTLQSLIPEYVRLNRVYRDISAKDILAGSKTANLRQIVDMQMYKQGLVRRDISAREIRMKNNNPDTARIEIHSYEASGGIEYFLQMIDPADRTIFGLCRLRIPSSFFSKEPVLLSVLENAALIRELHVFGDQLPIGYIPENNEEVQHRGFGKRLLEQAEAIVKEQYPDMQKIAIIAGVGVRDYYKKRGYTLEEEYMVKSLKDG